MGKVIAIANHKGGVGKTTSVASIGAVLAQKGKKTLIIDLDAQANLTGSLSGEQYERTIYDALREREGLPVVQISENLFLTPSCLDLAGIELEISSSMSREFALKDVVEPVAGDYDFILLDCPPSLGLLTVNAFVAADEIIIPLTAEALPFQGLTMIGKIITMVQKRLNTSLRLSGILFTRWEGRKLNKMVEEAVRGSYGDIVFRSRVRTNISIAEAPLSKQDIIAYNEKSNGAQDYIEVTDELLAREAGKR